MKFKRPHFRRYYYAYCSEKYNPENDLLYLEELGLPDTYDLEEIIARDGYLETQEMYKAYYNSDQDVNHFVAYWEKKQRDMSYENMY